MPPTDREAAVIAGCLLLLFLLLLAAFRAALRPLRGEQADFHTPTPTPASPPASPALSTEERDRIYADISAEIARKRTDLLRRQEATRDR